MCYKKKCAQCGLTTWGGCGRHIKDALEDVPDEELCKCHEPQAAPYLRGQEESET